MMMPGRKYEPTSSYRYGFNGKEKDKDISEGGQDYGMRINDARLGRFLSVDPITKKYPELTPYQFASNSPIQGIDLDGLELYFTVEGNLLGKFGKSLEIRIVNSKEIVTTIKNDVKAKLNVAEAEYTSYKLNSASLNETLRQISETKKSETPIGLSAVVDSKGNVTQGKNMDGFVHEGSLYTPEFLPNFTEPVSDADKDGFTVIHSHPMDAFTKNSENKLVKVPYDDRTVSGIIYNVGEINKVNPSPLDNANGSINGKNYNLILVGNVVPIKQTEVNPMQSNGPKVFSEGTAGATFYKGKFSNGGFDMTEKALKKMQKTVEDQTKAAKAEEKPL